MPCKVKYWGNLKNRKRVKMQKRAAARKAIHRMETQHSNFQMAFISKLLRHKITTLLLSECAKSHKVWKKNVPFKPILWWNSLIQPVSNCSYSFNQLYLQGCFLFNFSCELSCWLVFCTSIVHLIKYCHY